MLSVLSGLVNFDTLMVLLAEAGLTVGITLLMARLPRVNDLLAGLAGGLAVPVLFLALGFWALTRPNPRHIDAPGMVFAGSLMLAALATPVGVLVSAVTLLLRRRWWRRMVRSSHSAYIHPG
jgi:hypothetical protein